MSGFIATGANNSGANSEIINNTFFPGISLSKLRASLRLDGAVTDARLEQAAIAAIIDVNNDLQPFADKLKQYEQLADAPADSIGGKSIYLHLYYRAIYCTVGAELAERYRSHDATTAGNQRADDLAPSIDEYRRTARFAIRDLLQKVRVTVELI